MNLILEKGIDGFGGPLVIPVNKNKKVLSVTGSGIHPLARKIAEIAGVEVCDAFKNPVADEDVLCVVINCAGTLRCGVYPQKGIFTININPIGPSGPLAQHMNEQNYISGITNEGIHLSEDGTASVPKAKSEKPEPQRITERRLQNENFFIRMTGAIGGFVGKYTALFYQAGKDSIDTVLKTVLPFMAFISVLVGIIMYTGIGSFIANLLIPLVGSLPGLILLSIICGLPFLSPVLGAGAAVAQVVGVLIGVEIGKGSIPPQYALPALFAINIQVGADFVPVGLSMQEAKPETIKYGTPAFLISRCITGPICVILAWLFSFGMF